MPRLSEARLAHQLAFLGIPSREHLSHYLRALEARH
jgi:hypothetical protein